VRSAARPGAGGVRYGRSDGPSYDRECARRALSLVGETGGKALEPFIRVELSNLARLAGDEPARQRELREAHRLFLEIGAPIRAAEVAKELRLAETT
jgi:hypothetical protein